MKFYTIKIKHVDVWHHGRRQLIKYYQEIRAEAILQVRSTGSHPNAHWISLKSDCLNYHSYYTNVSIKNVK